MHLEVHKFGGTSLRAPEQIRWAAERVQSTIADATPVVVVVSAIAGATDELFTIAALARSGDAGGALTRLAVLEEQHLELLSEISSGDELEATRTELAKAFALDRRLLETSGRLGELSGFAENTLLSLGERASSYLVATALRMIGLESLALDAHSFLVTDEGPVNALPLQDELREGTRALLLPQIEAGRVPVVTGFVGRNRAGRCTTLGRSGSDLSATTIAAALDAKKVVLWTDVDGIQSADPNIVPEARTLARMHFSEAATLASLGAEVVHERATLPVAERGIPIFVRKSGQLVTSGTEISGEVEEQRPTVRAIGVLSERALVIAKEPGLELLGKVAGALSAGASSLIVQPSAASPLGLVIPAADLGAVLAVVPDLEVHDDVTQVALVGHRLSEAGDVTGRAVRALSEARIARIAVATSDASSVASILIPSSDVEGAVRALHEEFRLERGPVEEEAALGVELFVLGAGRAATAWLQALEAGRPRLVERFGLGPRLGLLADGASATVMPSGIEGELATRVEHALEAGEPLPHGSVHVDDFAPERVVEARMKDLPRRPVLVDLFPDPRGLAARDTALALGADVVIAHPEALGTCAQFQHTLQLARSHDRQVFFESALVPGLPVREAIERLEMRGNPVAFIEASLSGAVTGALSRADEGAAFSTAWFEILERDNFGHNCVAELSGRAIVARALALGVAAGLFTDEVEIQCRGLVDESAEQLDANGLHELLLAKVDASVRDRVEGALDFGERLRFVARLEPGKLEVAPLEVPRESPIGSLHGTDNVIALYARDARREPLVLRGPGARARVFQASVFGDLVRAFERR